MKGLKNHNYFLTPTSNENNFIHLFITQTPDEDIKTVFVLAELRVPGPAILYQFSKVLLQCKILLLWLADAHINHGLLSWKQTEDVQNNARNFSP